VTVEGAAALARTRYLTAVSLFRDNGNPLFSDDPHSHDSLLLDRLLTELNRIQISEEVMRELARTEPWRNFWACRQEGLFGVPVSDYSQEQLRLVGYSLFFDSIYEHAKCPSQEIIADDDVLDGWLILQRREREKEQIKLMGDEKVGNDKIRNSQEVYLMADSVADAKKIDLMNDKMSSMTKKQRFAFLKQKGIVNELEMPDTKQRLRIEAVRKISGSQQKT
jgi:hypothetical protein